MKTALALSPLKTKFTPLFFSGEVEYGIQMAKELGYDGVELSIKNPREIDVNAIIDVLKKNKIKVSTIATGQSYVDDGLFFGSEDDEVRKRLIERIKEIVDFAAKVEANVILGGIRGKNNIGIDHNLLCKIKGAVFECCEYAGERGVGIIIEPVNHYEVSFIHTVKEAVEFIKDINHSTLSVLYDTYHVNIEERSIIEPLIEAGNLLSHVHFADNNRLAPGYGCFNFTEVLRTLEAIGYSGYICMEALPWPDSLTAARQGIEFLKTCLSGN